MGLSAREQQALDSIKDWLARSDPRLVALLTTFTRLVSHEEMPTRESIRVGSARAAGCPCGKRRHPQRARAVRPVGRTYPRLGMRRALIVLCMLMTAGMITLGIVLAYGGSQPAYAPPRAVSGTASTSVHGSRPPAQEKQKTAPRRALGPHASAPDNARARHAG